MFSLILTIKIFFNNQCKKVKILANNLKILINLLVKLILI